MNTRRLHDQADRIEWVLNQHRAPARVTGGRVTPRTIQFHVTPVASTKVAQLEKLSEEIALALGASHARITRDKHQLSIEVPREHVSAVRLMTLVEQIRRDEQLARAVHVRGTAVLGLDAYGIPLLVRLGSPDVTHILVSGTTGSGKTEAVKTLLASLVLYQKPRELQLLLIDPKGGAFRVFEPLPHLLCAIATDLRDAMARLRWLEDEMERRQTENVLRPRIVLVLDELADLLMQGEREFQVHLTRLAQRGRSAGISIIACTQKPSASILKGTLKANFPVRLVGRVASTDDARVASGVGGTGAEKLAGHGDFVLVAGGERVRFQSAYLPPEDVPLFIAQVQANIESKSRQRGLGAIVRRLTAL